MARDPDTGSSAMVSEVIRNGKQPVHPSYRRRGMGTVRTNFIPIARTWQFVRVQASAREYASKMAGNRVTAVGLGKWGGARHAVQ
jgi:hypothetical protein